jgi:hypothetical protein
MLYKSENFFNLKPVTNPKIFPELSLSAILNYEDEHGHD